MNQTIVGYSRGKKVGKTNRIGIDKGFDNPSTIDSATRKPYLNRRFVYH